MKGLKLDRFVLLLLVMIFLAWLAPGIDRVIPLDQISSYGISGIFFFYGLKLSPANMIAGLSNWRLHLLIQVSTFIFFPLAALVCLLFVQTQEQYTLWLAVLFLAALPSTVSSSVVMVSIARGNIPGAIFNASISGLIGIVVTPLWMGLFMSASGGEFNVWQSLLELVVKILLPVIVGFLLHQYWGRFADKYREQLSIYDRTILLVIVYKSFSESFTSGIFDTINHWDLAVIALESIALFFLVYIAIGFISARMKFNREDRITALFCGSKKSLVHGSVFSEVLFSRMSNAGIFLVPIMIYHAFQLMVISVIAQRMRVKNLENS